MMAELVSDGPIDKATADKFFEEHRLRNEEDPSVVEAIYARHLRDALLGVVQSAKECERHAHRLDEESYTAVREQAEGLAEFFANIEE